MRNWLIHPMVKMASLLMTLPEASAQQPDCDIPPSVGKQLSYLALLCAGIIVGGCGIMDVVTHIRHRRYPEPHHLAGILFGTAGAIAGYTWLNENECPYRLS